MTAIALSNDALRKAAPSIFADHPWERVSERYAFIPTIQVVDALRGVTTTNKRTSTRAIKSVSEDIRLNKALWMLAEALGKAVA